jgi:hypothetical protein
VFYVASCKCFIWILHIFHAHILSVCSKCFISLYIYIYIYIYIYNDTLSTSVRLGVVFLNKKTVRALSSQIKKIFAIPSQRSPQAPLCFLCPTLTVGSTPLPPPRGPLSSPHARLRHWSCASHPHRRYRHRRPPHHLLLQLERRGRCGRAMPYFASATRLLTPQ